MSNETARQQSMYPHVEALRACPFCGGDAETRMAMDEYWVHCCQCGASCGGHHMHEHVARAAWNRRTTRTDWAQMLVYAANHQLDVLQDILVLQDDSAIEALTRHAHADLSAAIAKAKRAQEGGEG